LQILNKVFYFYYFHYLMKTDQHFDVWPLSFTNRYFGSIDLFFFTQIIITSNKTTNN